MTKIMFSDEKWKTGNNLRKRADIRFKTGNVADYDKRKVKCR